MTAQTGEKPNAINMLPYISGSEGNQTIKFRQLIENNTRNIFLEKSCTECDGEASPRTIFNNWPYLSINGLMFHTFCLYFMFKSRTTIYFIFK